MLEFDIVNRECYKNITSDWYVETPWRTADNSNSVQPVGSLKIKIRGTEEVAKIYLWT